MERQSKVIANNTRTFKRFTVDLLIPVFIIMNNTSTDFRKITVFVFDIDGVLTDGTVLVMENGLQARRMNIKDGYALQLAVKNGYRILVISGAGTSPVIERLNKLGITEVFFSIKDKKTFIENFKTENKLSPEEILYMGDDIPDMDAMSVVGIAACPADAATEIQQIASYISPFSGGSGCVRDVIGKVLKLNNHWQHKTDVASG
jgi:3-deoxy-D-manno-octulosonate 8-phosphate phosphatase (KDO 8-P phosphatase)